MATNATQSEERLIRIESSLAHLQREIEELNASLTEHFRRLQGFEQRFVRIEHEFSTLAEGREDGDAESEKPPHY